ncbi:MAG: type II toxin-antitoxin system HicA family toxin [Euryarchaeota archaeon]|nr:type II toxin-antitoxin system HicA family toxin [Euryarchaeota archaeon]
MRLPSLTARDVIKKLKKAGFVFDRQAKGSHERPFIYPTL